MRNRNGALIPGLALILAGAWLLLRNLGVPLPGLEVVWPVLPLAFGLGLLVQSLFGGQADGLAFMGVAASLTGAFFFLFTLGPLRWEQMGSYWPVFVLIAGLAFLAQWLARPADRGLLVPAALGLGLGSVALIFTLGLAGPEVLRAAAQLWPLALILAGVGLLARYFLRPPDRGTPSASPPGQAGGRPG